MDDETEIGLYQGEGLFLAGRDQGAGAAGPLQLKVICQKRLAGGLCPELRPRNLTHEECPLETHATDPRRAFPSALKQGWLKKTIVSRG